MRCEICLKHSPILCPPDWITLKTYKNSHQKAAPHRRCVELQTREEEAEEMMRQNAPDYFAMPIAPTVLSSHQEPRKQNTPPDIMQEMWDQFDGTFELDRGTAEAHESAHLDFESKMGEYGLWDGQEAMAADIDMSHIEELWDEEDHDDLLLELLKQIGLSCLFH